MASLDRDRGLLDVKATGADVVQVMRELFRSRPGRPHALCELQSMIDDPPDPGSTGAPTTTTPSPKTLSTHSSTPAHAVLVDDSAPAAPLGWRPGASRRGRHTHEPALDAVRHSSLRNLEDPADDAANIAWVPTTARRTPPSPPARCTTSSATRKTTRIQVAFGPEKYVRLARSSPSTTPATSSAEIRTSARGACLTPHVPLTARRAAWLYRLTFRDCVRTDPRRSHGCYLGHGHPPTLWSAVALIRDFALWNKCPLLRLLTSSPLPPTHTWWSDVTSTSVRVGSATCWHR